MLSAYKLYATVLQTMLEKFSLLQTRVIFRYDFSYEGIYFHPGLKQ